LFEEKIGRTNMLGISVIKDFYVTIKFPVSMKTHYLNDANIPKSKYVM